MRKVLSTLLVFLFLGSTLHAQTTQASKDSAKAAKKAAKAQAKADKAKAATTTPAVTAPPAPAPVVAPPATAKTTKPVTQGVNKTADKAVGTDAKGRTIYEGPKGGRYTLTAAGNKEYIKKAQ